MANERELKVVLKFGTDKSAEAAAKRIEAALREVERQANETGEAGGKSFSNIGKSGGLLASSLTGAVGGAVAALTTKFLEFSSQAIQQLKEIADEAVQMNSDMEQNVITFTNIFGDEDTANAFIDNLREKSIALGLDFQQVAGFAKAVVPDTNSMAQFNDVLLRLKQASVESGKSIDDVRVAFDEAISGSMTSLQTRLNIPLSVTRKIKEAGDATGDYLTPLLEELGARYDKLGIDIESFAGTFQNQQDQMTGSVNNLKLALGDSIFDQQKEFYTELNQVLGENSDKYQLMAARLGDIVAAVLEFLQTNFVGVLQSLDNEKALILLDTIYELVDTTRTFISVAMGLNDESDFVNESINDMIWFFGKLNEAMTTASQLAALVKAGWAGLTGGPEAAAESFKQSLESMQEHTDRLVKDSERKQDRIDKLTEKNSSKGEKEDIDFSQTKLGENQALEAAQKEAQKYEDALNSVSDAEADLAKKHASAMDKIAKDTEEAFVDAAIDAARARQDIERDYLRSIEDINRDHQKKISEANFQEEEMAIAKEQSQERADLEREATNERLDIEKGYQRELRAIKEQYKQDADDAIRNQDAIALLQARKRQELAIQAAKQARDDDLSDAKEEAGRKAEDVQIEQQREIEQAREAHQQKMIELQTSLEEELAEANLARERDLQDQQTAENRKLEDIRLSNERKLEEQRKADAQRQADLRASLEEELKIIEEYEAKKAQAKDIALKSLPGLSNFTKGRGEDDSESLDSPEKARPYLPILNKPISSSNNQTNNNTRNMNVTISVDGANDPEYVAKEVRRELNRAERVMIG